MISECVGFNAPLDRHIASHFKDESFQATDCTGTDNQNNETRHYIHQKHKRETEKTALANKTFTP